MPWDRSLPPDTRSLNSPDPADDHNKDVKALSELRTKLGDLPDAAVDSLFKWDGSKLVEVPSGTFNRRIVRSIKEFDGYNGDGGDNTTAINNAIDALDPSQGGPGGIVWLENVTSLVASTITVPDGVGLAGADNAATVVRADVAMSAVVVFSGEAEHHANFRVDGNGLATNGIVVQNTARSIFSNIWVIGGTDRNWLVDESWDGGSGNNVLTVFEYCLGSGSSANTTNSWEVIGGVNSNGMLFLQCYGHHSTGSGMLLGGLANRVIGGTWINNGAYGIDVNGGQSHYIEHPWLESNTTAGMVFSGSDRSHVYLPTQAGQGVDWANSQDGNSEVAVRNAGGLASHVYRAAIHPELGDDARAASDGVNTFPLGYSVFRDAAGTFPAGAGGHVETYADASEGRQRNWTEGSSTLRERVSIDGATWRPWFTYQSNDAPSARVERSTDQTISTGTNTSVTWEAAEFDNTGGNMWASGSPTVLTLPEAGVYLLTAGTIWRPDGTGRRITSIRVGGTEVAASVTHPTDNGQTTVSTLVQASASTNVDLRVLQESGGDLDLIGIPRLFLAAQKVAEV